MKSFGEVNWDVTSSDHIQCHSKLSIRMPTDLLRALSVDITASGSMSMILVLGHKGSRLSPKGGVEIGGNHAALIALVEFERSV